jgi:opacity protein-like surface antigen
MKKIILIAVGLFITGAVNAQVTFGLKGGVDVSNIIKTDDPDFTTTYKAGFNAGITMEVQIVSPLSIAPELLYAQKGYKAQTTFGNFTQTTNFIDIPILAKIKFAEGFNVVVGPQVSFLTSTTNVYSNGFSTTVQKQYNDDSDNFRKSLIAGVAGISFDLSKSVDLHARYALDLQKNNENGTSQTPEYRNQVFEFGLGFKMY